MSVLVQLKKLEDRINSSRYISDYYASKTACLNIVKDFNLIKKDIDKSIEKYFKDNVSETVDKDTVDLIMNFKFQLPIVGYSLALNGFDAKNKRGLGADCKLNAIKYLIELLEKLIKLNLEIKF